MLDFFPAPYPEEWWYSVLCRYHVRSGNIKYQTTTSELFGRPNAAIASVYPNGNIKDVFNKIGPPPPIPLKRIVLENTLFKFFTRFRPYEEKQAMLNKAMEGSMLVITSIRRFSNISSWRPRFCPACAAEETERYGEPYWHIDHQIPMMTHCPLHGYVLQQIDIPESTLDYAYIPLSSVLAGMYSTAPCSVETFEWMLPLCKVLHDYYVMPLEVSINPDYSNLAITLSNMGYQVIQKASAHTIVNAKSIYQDMTNMYGQAVMCQQYGSNQKSAIAQINRLCKWQGQVPERYALLQLFAGIDSATLFSLERIQDSTEIRLKELMQAPVLLTKKQIMKRLGVTALQLDNLLKKYGLSPFWRPSADNSIRKPYKIRCSMTEEDYGLLDEAFKESGYRYSSEFVEHLLLSILRK